MILKKAASELRNRGSSIGTFPFFIAQIETAAWITGQTLARNKLLVTRRMLPEADLGFANEDEAGPEDGVLRQSEEPTAGGDVHFSSAQLAEHGELRGTQG
jgi:hypothetical protein